MGLPHGRYRTQLWLSGEVKAGRVKRLTGLTEKEGKLIRAVRYIIS